MTGTRWVYTSLAAFFLGLVLFWPRVLLIVDEERYVSQAVAFARGERSLPGSGIVFPATGHETISNYPPGTSLLQAPFVAIGGWRAAALASAIALALATLATMRWLTAHGGHAAFALLVPGFIAASFFGRIAMSDVPAAALVAITGWLLWRAEGAHATRSLLAGTAAGAVTLFREPVLLLVFPLLLGAAVRRAAVPWALAAGFTGALLSRVALNAVLFGSPWYLRDPGVRFAVESLSHTVPVHGLVLLVLIPGAALLPLLYRGPRRAELVAAVVAYVLLFLLYDYDAIALNGRVKGLMLAARFMIPATPLLALLAADVWPRVLPALARWSAARGNTLLHIAGLGVATVAFAVHPLAARQERTALHIQQIIQEHTRANVPVITNTAATLKYLSPAYSARRLFILDALPPDSLGPLSRRFAVMDVVVLDRSDSPKFSAASEHLARFVHTARERCEAGERFSGAMPDGSHLRVLELRACR